MRYIAGGKNKKSAGDLFEIGLPQRYKYLIYEFSD